MLDFFSQTDCCKSCRSLVCEGPADFLVEGQKQIKKYAQCPEHIISIAQLFCQLAMPYSDLLNKESSKVKIINVTANTAVGTYKNSRITGNVSAHTSKDQLQF